MMTYDAMDKWAIDKGYHQITVLIRDCYNPAWLGFCRSRQSDDYHVKIEWLTESSGITFAFTCAGLDAMLKDHTWIEERVGEAILQRLVIWAQRAWPEYYCDYVARLSREMHEQFRRESCIIQC